MTITIFIAGFFLGAITGAIALVMGTIMIGRRAMLRAEEASKLPPTSKIESVAERFKKVKEITAEQLDLQGQISGPQKNALHGRYKNGLNGRLKELEQQKYDILSSIVKDGHDPEITAVTDDGVTSSIKLSEFLNQMGQTIGIEKTNPVAATTKQVGKFTVHKGGKDDGSDTVH